MRAARSAYQAWRQGDFDTATAPPAEEIVYTLHMPSSTHPLGGQCVGKEQTCAYLSKLREEFDMEAFEPGPILADEAHVAAQVGIRYVNRTNGERLEMKLTHFWIVRDGEVVGCDEYLDLAALEDYSRRLALIGG